MISQSSPAYIWICAAALVMIAAFNSWISRINQFFFFSRTAQPGFVETPVARQITAGYLRGVWLGLAVAAAVYGAAIRFSTLSVITSFGLALLVRCVCACIAFGRAHAAAGIALASGNSAAPSADELPASNSAVVSVPLLDPGAFTPRLFTLLLSAPVIAAAAWFGSMLSAHMGFSQFNEAMATNKADFLNGLGLGLLSASVLLYIQLRYFSRHRSPMARFTARGCVWLAWFGAASIALSTLSVPLHLVITPEIRRILLGIVLGFALLRVFYGWTRARLFPPPQVERNGDQFWRWGMFYYNPSDPTLFIQHRSGPGYTLNFANFMSWPLAFVFFANLAILMCLHPHR